MSLFSYHTSLKKSDNGFTLTELMITVGILGILAAIAVPIYNGYIAISKRNAAETVLEQFPILLESYRADNGTFPPNGNYVYSETDAGAISVDTIRGTGAGKAGLTDFKPKEVSAGTQAVLYHYTLTIANSGTPNETATFQAIPQTNRGAPSGNIPTPAATYK